MRGRRDTVLLKHGSSSCSRTGHELRMDMGSDECIVAYK